jgi:hypothetical protein
MPTRPPACLLFGALWLAALAGAAQTPPASTGSAAPAAAPDQPAPPAAATQPAAQPAPAQPAAQPAPAKGKRGSKTAAPAKPAAPAKTPPPPPKPPVPNAALAQLKPLAGSWACTGRTFGPGPEHATSAAMTFSWHLDGFWLEVRYDEPKTAANPVPLSAIAEWGFDEVQQALAAVAVDNFGGSAVQSAPGWQGDKLVFEGAGHRYAVQFQARDSFLRHGDGQLAHTFEADVNGSWIKLHEDTCTRVPAK